LIFSFHKEFTPVAQWIPALPDGKSRQGAEFRKKMEKYFIYILKSLIRDITYVGCTNDLNRRLDEHNSGKSKFTSKYKPWQIIYSEETTSQKEALKLEKYYKSSAGRKKIKTILS